MRRTQTFKWFSRFKCGKNAVEDSERSGRPSTSRTDENVENVVPPRQMVNQHYYLEVLKRLMEQFRRKRPERWRNQDWLLHYDNAPAHIHSFVQRLVAAKNMAMVHPSLLTRFGPLRFLLISENEIEANRASFPGYHRNSGTIAERPTRDSEKSVPAVLSAVAEVLNPLHKLGRGITSRGEQRIIPKVSAYFIIESVRKLLDTLS
jgi:hypothetical protein